jgi:hypothetical protein
MSQPQLSNGVILGEFNFSTTPTSLPDRGGGNIHRVMSLNKLLGPGSYYIGLHANLDGISNSMNWATSNGGQAANTPAWARITVVPGTFDTTGQDFGFVLVGHVVPEPATWTIVLLLGAGCHWLRQ